MSYSSPLAARNWPADSPAIASRTVRLASSALTPSRPAFCVSMPRFKSVRRSRTGFSTSRVPGVSFRIRSTRAARLRNPSISGPTMRIATGASIGGPCSNCLSAMRAAG